MINMNSRIIILVAFSIFCLYGCKKPNNFKACFITEKEIYVVNEEIVFENCSSFNKGDEDSGVIWSMGDDKAEFSFGNESITYKYESAGDYVVKLSIGYKEGPGDEIERVIKVIE
jgi:hypothetical protein